MRSFIWEIFQRRPGLASVSVTVTRSLLLPIKDDWKLATSFHMVRLNGVNTVAQAGCDVTALFNNCTRMEENRLSGPADVRRPAWIHFHLSHKIPKHHWENETRLWPFSIWRILCFHPVLSLHPWPSLAFLRASCLAVPPYHRYIYYPFSVHAQQLSNFLSKTSCLSSKRDDINRFAWQEYLKVQIKWTTVVPSAVSHV